MVARQLGLVAILIGTAMAFSLPWGMDLLGGEWAYERDGLMGLAGAMAVCFLVGAVLRRCGRRAEGQLFRREAMAIVGLSWVMATALGGLPYLLSGTHRTAEHRMGVIDAMFEAQSGFSTTGATVLTDLEDPSLVPRTILFWRSTTHFLGGLGIVVLFVAILGQGSAGKALMRAEMVGPSRASPQARMQQTAWILCLVYFSLNALLAFMLWLLGLGAFDALCHAFGTMATGGFSTYNASIGHFATVPGLNGLLIEMTIVLFMFIAGTSFILLYLSAFRGPKRLFGDAEWRVYAGLLVGATLAVTAYGLYSGDFAEAEATAGERTARPGSPPPAPGGIDATTAAAGEGVEPATGRLPLGRALRYSSFQVVSIMTTTGFVTTDTDRWHSFARGLLLVLMFIGGCAGSTGGGLKVIRYVLLVKILGLEVERAFHPSVVRPLRLGDTVLEEQELRRTVPLYFAVITLIFLVAWLFTITVEPDRTWTAAGLSPAHKLLDSASAVAATLNNIGPGLGVVGAAQNYTHFSPPTKLLFTGLMMLGRLEVFVILALFSPRFWRR